MVTAHTAHSDQVCRTESSSLAFARTTLEKIAQTRRDFPDQVPEPRALLAWTTQKRIDYRLYGWCKMIVARDGELWNEINAQAEADVRKGSSSTTEDRQLVVDSLLRALEANSEGFNYLHDHNWDIIISALKKENMVRFPQSCVSSHPTDSILVFSSNSRSLVKGTRSTFGTRKSSSAGCDRDDDSRTVSRYIAITAWIEPERVITSSCCRILTKVDSRSSTRSSSNCSISLDAAWCNRP